jgi:hypothetical protein
VLLRDEEQRVAAIDEGLELLDLMDEAENTEPYKQLGEWIFLKLTIFRRKKMSWPPDSLPDRAIAIQRQL